MNKITDKELYELCKKYGQNAKEWSRKFAALLPEVYKRKLYKKYGFASIKEFAKKIGGLSESVVEEVLRTYKKVEDKPLLIAQIEKVGWSKVRAIATIATKTNEEEMVKLIKTLPKKALEQYTKDIKKQNAIQQNSGQNSFLDNLSIRGAEFKTNTSICKNPPGWESKSVNFNFKIDKETEFQFRKFKNHLEKKRKESITFGEVLRELLIIANQPQMFNRQLNAQCHTDHHGINYDANRDSGNPNHDSPQNPNRASGNNASQNLNKGTERNAQQNTNRNISQNSEQNSEQNSNYNKKSNNNYETKQHNNAANNTPSSNHQQQPTLSRSRYIPKPIKEKKYNNGMCAFPGCFKPSTVLHHQDRYALVKNHNKIVPLCDEHHQIAHAGLIENEEKHPVNWSLRKQTDRYLLTSLIDRKYQQARNLHPT